MRVVHRSLAQAKKELAQFRRDWLTVGLAYALPFLALLMYGFATRLESEDIEIAVINYDSGKLSRDYIDTLFATNQFVRSNWSGTSVFAPLDSGQAKACVLIPPEFSRRIKSGGTADIQIMIDGTDVNNARVIQNGLYALSNYFLRQQGLRHDESVVGASTRLWFNPGRREALYIVPGAIALVTWVFPALLSAFSLVREKEQGTVLQLYASSITALEVILGKSLAYFLVGMVESGIVICAGMIVFGVPFIGAVLPFVLYTALYVYSGVIFGLWAGSRAHNQMAAVQICATIGFIGSMLLSGFIYPIRNITYPISLLSNLVPARYYIEAARDAFVRGGDWTAHWYIPIVLLSIDLFLLVATTAGMRKMQLAK